MSLVLELNEIFFLVPTTSRFPLVSPFYQNMDFKQKLIHPQSKNVLQIIRLKGFLLLILNRVCTAILIVFKIVKIK